jgi:ribonuclease P protein component
MKPFSLNKHERLKGKKNIETLFLTGKAFFCAPYKIIYNYDTIRKPTETPVLMSVAVSKKNCKLAVQRNYIKRLTREVFRTQKTTLYNAFAIDENKQLHVMFLYTSKVKPTITEVETSIQKGIEKLIKTSKAFAIDDEINDTDK